MTLPQSPLAHFRAECYQTFGLRRDALHDLLDAVLTSDRVTSLVRLSLAPAFRRGWPSLFDALTDGTLDLAALQRLWVQTLPLPPPGQRPLWVIDGSTWPRPEAKTSPERTCCRFVTPGIPESGIMPGWEYQWLVAIPEPQGSWMLPLDLRRRGPQAGSPTQLAIAQLQAVLASYQGPRPVVVLDSHYAVADLGVAVPAVDLLARLACNRRYYRAPPPYPGTGRPRTHGPVFRLADPTTQGGIAVHQVLVDPDYGLVRIDGWTGLHTQPAPDVAVSVLRVTVAHLPRRTEPPAPLWLVWHGGALPTDRPDRGLALVPAPVRRRAWISLRQAGPGLDGPAPAGSPGGRPLECAGRQCLLGTLAGPTPGRRCPLALGTSAGPGHRAQPGPGAAADGGTFGPVGQPGPTPPDRAERRPDGTSGSDRGGRSAIRPSGAPHLRAPDPASRLQLPRPVASLPPRYAARLSKLKSE